MEPQVNRTEESDVSPVVPENGILYSICPNINGVYFLSKRSFQLVGPLRHFFIWTALFAACFYLIYTFVNLLSLSRQSSDMTGTEVVSFSASTYIVLVAVIIIVLFGRVFLRLLRNGVHLIGMFGPLNSVMLLRTVKMNDEYLNHREIVIRTYKAQCNICGGYIFLRKSWRNRQVFGECKENPLMHRYTFDFTNNTGERIK